MSDRFSLVRWRDAKTDPPKGDPHRRLFAFTRHGEPCLPEAGAVARQPDEYTVWCDPSPPGDDAPTLKDLQRAHDALLYASGNLDHGILTVVYPEECEASATRIRRAIEEAER